jgi:hypothetical protein
MAVGDFKRQNPDLVKHERIVNAFMAETDQSKPWAERLDDAAKETRRYLASLTSGQGSPPPGGAHYVEPPSGGSVPMTPVAPGATPPGTQNAEETELMEYIKERQEDWAAKFGMKTK